jgi:hydrogenase expression/formation protein HypE
LRRDRSPRPGDALLVSGPLGDHGAVILAARFEVELAGDLVSDCAPVTGLVDALFAAGVVPLFMRDPTRGGLANLACDVAEQLELGLELEEAGIPVRPDVETLCELVGVDPLHLACEGRVAALVAGEQAEAALAAWRALPAGTEARCVGRLGSVDRAGQVTLTTRFGGRRRVVRPTAELLPRIC